MQKTNGTYRVRCDDCEITKSYEEKKPAVLRMVEHAKATEHSALVEEPNDE